MPEQASIEQDEVQYLCEQASRYFKRPVQSADVVWTYAGVRPLLEDASKDASAVTRDYVLETSDQGAPLMTVWGGKITTYRKLAEQAATQLGVLLGQAGRPWTEDAVLPGGDLSAWTQTACAGPDLGMVAFVSQLQARYPWVPVLTLRRWAQAYGTQIPLLVGSAQCLKDLGPTEVTGLYRAELRYLIQAEWARTADDVLWRRSKLGLHLTPAQCAHVAACMTRLLPA